MSVTIYALADPRTDRIRYVGKANDIDRRYRDHLRQSRGKWERCHRISWLKSLHDEGLDPRLLILEIVPESEWESAEMGWISHLRLNGCQLVNGDGGGNGGKVVSTITRARMGEAVRRRWKPLTRDQRLHAMQHLIKANTGRKKSDAERQAISLRMTGRKGRITSDETRGKLRLHMLKNPRKEWHTPEAIEKGRLRKLGRRIPGRGRVGYMGVLRQGNRYQAYARINKKHKYLGMFATSVAAARAYDAVMRDVHGPEGRFNFPLPGEHGIHD